MSKVDQLLKRAEFYEKVASQVPEANSLLNKATVFERLALYSDRKSFLQALGQSPVLSQDIRSGIESAMKDIAAVKPDSSQPLQNQLMDYYSGTKTDLDGLVKALQQAAYLMPPQNYTQKDRIVGLANKVYQLAQSKKPQTQSQEDGEDVMQMPADKITGYAPIPTTVQKHLSELVATRGWGIPLHRIDGKLGPSTRQALNNFKSRMKLPANTTDAQVFSIIEKEYSKEHPVGQNLDEAAKSRAEYEKSQFYPPGTKPPV